MSSIELPGFTWGRERMSRKGDFRCFSSSAEVSEPWLLAPPSSQRGEGTVGEKGGLCGGKWLWQLWWGRYLFHPFSPVDIKVVFILIRLLFPSSPLTCSCCHSPSEALELREEVPWGTQISMGTFGRDG